MKIEIPLYAGFFL